MRLSGVLMSLVVTSALFVGCFDEELVDHEAELICDELDIPTLVQDEVEAQDIPTLVQVEVEGRLAAIENRLGALEEAIGIPYDGDGEVAERLVAVELAVGIPYAAGVDLDGRVQSLEDAGFLTTETDPVASAAGYLTSYTETDPVASAAGYLTSYTETDPVASAAGYLTSFTETDPVASVAGYLTSYTETDPVASAAGYLMVETDPVAMAEIPDLEAGIEDLEANKLGRIGSLVLVVSTVPAADEFATISDALAWLDGYSIDSNATVQIQVQAGTYSSHPTVYVRHPNADRIEILGAGPNLVTLEFAGSGFVIHSGNALGLLDGVTIEGPGASSNKIGVDVRSNSLANVGADVTIRHFNIGVFSSAGSVVYAEGVEIHDVAVGLSGVETSYLYAHSASVHDTDGYGVGSAGNSYIDVRNSIVDSNIGGDGYSAWQGGILIWDGGTGTPDSSVSGDDPAFISP